MKTEREMSLAYARKRNLELFKSFMFGFFHVSKSGVGKLRPAGRMRPGSNSCAARRAPRGKQLINIMCIFAIELWVRPATKLRTHFRPVAVKRLPTTALRDYNWVTFCQATLNSNFASS